MKRLLALLAAFAVLMLPTAALAGGGQGHDPITICHAVEGKGNTGNGYNLITVDAESILTKGHSSHPGDIIPAFDGFAGQGDASWIANDCAAPTVEPPVEEPGVDTWSLSAEANCESMTFSHPKFKVSTDPEYRVDINGVEGQRTAYVWGEQVTIPAPDETADTTWEVRIFAKNPDLGGAYQQLGSKKVSSTDCKPFVEPPVDEPEPVVETDVEHRLTECVDGQRLTEIRHRYEVDGVVSSDWTDWRLTDIEPVACPVPDEPAEDDVNPVAEPGQVLPATGLSADAHLLAAGLGLLGLGAAGLLARRWIR